MSGVSGTRRISSWGRWRSVGALLTCTIGLAACLDLPSDRVIECHHTEECNVAAGEICAEDLCWGAAPQAEFAAVVAPPANAKGLVLTEYPIFDVPRDGWFGDLALETPRAIFGDISFACPPPLECQTVTDVTVTATRPSTIAGGPAFRAVIKATPSNGAASFELRLPQAAANEEPFSVTVLAQAKRPGLATNATLVAVPPVRFTIPATATSQRIAITLGAGTLPTLSGRILDANGRGVAGYRVYARGRWDDDATLAQVSTEALTSSDGSYQLALATDLASGLEIYAEPPTSGAGTLRVVLPAAPTVAAVVDMQLPAQVMPPANVIMRVMGTTRNGEVHPVVGAQVRLTATLSLPRAPSVIRELVTGDAITTNLDGLAQLRLVPAIGGALVHYNLAILPPSASEYQPRLNAIFEVGDPTMHQLEPRIAVQCEITDGAGTPVPNVAVTPSLSATQVAELPDQTRQDAPQLSYSTVTSDANGRFVVQVDALSDQASEYDLTFEPPAMGVRAPRFVAGAAFAVRPRTGTWADLNTFVAPDAARIRGRIVSGSGAPVPGAEVLLYSRNLNLACAPGTDMSSCPAGPALVARGTADADGIVRLVVPRI